MTADVELLPLPRWMETYRIPGDDFHVDPDQYLTDRLRDYARANVAAKDAEIEALRTKLAEYQVAESVAFSRQRVSESKAEEFRMRWIRAEERLAACDSDLHTMQHRAERLAEALVAERDRWAARKADAIREQAGGMTRGDPEAVARCDAAIQRIDALLRDQEKNDA